MESTTIPGELREIADQKQPWGIVRIETKLTDIEHSFSLSHTCQITKYTTALERATLATVKPAHIWIHMQ